MTELQFHKWDPSTIREYSSILFTGGRRTGKSFCMRDIMWHIKDRVYDATIFSGTIDPDHRWEKYTPSSLVHYCLEEFDEEGMMRSIKIQEKRKRLAEKYDAACPPTLMLFEDVGHLTPDVFKNKAMKSMVFNGRWARSYCFMAIQYLMDLKKGMRGSMDYAIFTMEQNASIRRAIYEQFGGIFPTFGEFETVFLELTKDKRVIVFDCRATSYKIEECVFWYKAQDRGFFHMGHPDVWARVKGRFDDDDDESDPEGEEERRKAIMERTRGVKGAKFEVKLLGDDGGEWGEDGEWKENADKKKKSSKPKKSR